MEGENELKDKNPNEYNIPDEIDKLNRFLNNLYTKVPGGYKRHPVDDIAKEIHKEWLGNTYIKSYGLNDRMSDKRLNETGQDFFDNIDSAVIEAGYTIEEIESLVIKVEQLKSQVDEERSRHLTREEKLKHLNVDTASKKELKETLEELQRKLVPIYIILRDKGYTHQDLIS